MIQPTPGKVVIEKDPPEEKHGLLYVPDTARENANIGTVVAINREVWWEQGTAYHPVCQLGDRVLVGKYAGVEIKYDGKDLLVMGQREILAILPKTHASKCAKCQMDFYPVGNMILCATCHDHATLGIQMKEDAGVHS